jgi:HEAT repeat protein
MQSDSSATRVSAALALSGTNDRDTVTALLGNLGDSDPTAGYYTALALTGNADPIAFDSLVAELESSDPLVRQRAALALSRSGVELPGGVIPALSAALDDSETAQAAALSLVGSTAPGAHDALLVALSDDELTTRRHAVMAAIEQAHPSIARAILGRALASDNLILVRNASVLRDFAGG